MLEPASIASMFRVQVRCVRSRARSFGGGEHFRAPFTWNCSRGLPLQALFESVKVHNRSFDLVIERTQALTQFV